MKFALIALIFILPTPKHLYPDLTICPVNNNITSR